MSRPARHSGTPDAVKGHESLSRGRFTHSVAEGAQLVPSVERAVRILLTLAGETNAATLASLSQGLGLPRSSTLALCNTLQRAGLLTRDTTKLYRLGPSTLELSRAYLAGTNLHGEFQRICQDLRILPNQTIVLGVRNGIDTVYIGQRPGLMPVGVSYEPGLHLPAHCTATGKALLSELDPDALLELYGGDPTTPLATLTPKSIDSYAALTAELEDVRQHGYSTDDEETTLGMICIGAPIRNMAGTIIGAVAASMLKAAVGPKAIAEATTEIRRLAHHLSTALGHETD